MKDNSSVSTAETNPFRVIVVGGGVGGLVASHCLQRANIDHVVLERRSTVAPAEGGSIGMYPQGSRILKQIGCLKPVEDACTDCLHYWLRKPNGKALADIPFWSNIKNKLVNTPNTGKYVFFGLRRNSSYLQLSYK
jgi:2-polyprenyl-6-methoxyphenol hydroxylase-like FAD-dependent oxidoreductase